MKVKVLQSFIDDKANVIQLKGTTIEVTEKRYKEITSKKKGLLSKQISEKSK